MTRLFCANLMLVTLIAVGCGALEADAAAMKIEMKPGAVVLVNGGASLPISTMSPKFTIDGVTIGGTAALSVIGNIKSGKPMQMVYAPTPLDSLASIETRQFVQWSPKESVVRKWAEYSIAGSGDSRVMQEIILDDIDTSSHGLKLLARQTAFLVPHSYPAFLEGFFAGVEFPIASTRITDGHVIVAHQPGMRMQPGVWYQSRKAVYGMTPKGHEWQAFRGYIESHRPEPRGAFVIYDNWLTTANAYTELEMLDLMHLLDQKLYRQNGVSLDAFRLVCTWSNPQSIWSIDRQRLPDGFTSFQKAVEGMGGKMGLWISPASCYPFAQDAVWAGKNGYETFTVGSGPTAMTNTCMAGSKYRAEFTRNLLDIVKTYDLRHIQFDGYRFDCPESNHGHVPGPLSAEAVAQGMTDVFQALRKASPHIYLHGAYGGNPSPWWLFYLNATLVYYGDDCPYGRVPAPSYRESYTTARDLANLQSSYYTPTPITAQDVYGLYDHAPFPFVNDAVMSVMRGHMTNSIIVNPRYKSDLDWARIADVTKWSRGNQSILKRTEPLLPISWQDGKCPQISGAATMPLEPYGYAHFAGSKGLIAVRNPWMPPTAYSLKLDESIGLSPKASGMSAVSVFPEVRVYAEHVNYGDTIQVPLAPYELIVLSIGRRQKIDGVAAAKDTLRKRIDVRISRKDVTRIQFDGPTVAISPDKVSAVGDAASALKVELGAVADIDAPQAELLVLLADKAAPVADPKCSIKVNGVESSVTFSDSETGFAAAGLGRPEHWLFIHAPLAKGRNTIAVDLMTHNDIPKVSIWVLAGKPGETKRSAYPNALPQPEILQLDSANLLSETSAGDPGLRTVSAPRPIEQIDGIYLDAIESAQISGGCMKNSNFLNQPMFVCGRLFQRGMCVVAPSKITAPLAGKYRRFQAHVGVDQGMAAYDKSGVVFQVLVDGVKRWDSGIVGRYDALKDVDVDLSGARIIELVVLEGLNEDPVYRSNWSDWGGAKLLR